VPVRITLYTKPGCHLCESAAQVIATVARGRTVEVETRNILDDPKDFTRYRYDIPVILVNGVEVARHALTAPALEAAIERVPGTAGNA
jgi:Glutaredoxin-like domain (DUF836)